MQGRPFLSVVRHPRPTPTATLPPAGPSARAELLYRWGELARGLDDDVLEDLLALAELDAEVMQGGGRRAMRA